MPTLAYLFFLLTFTLHFNLTVTAVIVSAAPSLKTDPSDVPGRRNVEGVAGNVSENEVLSKTDGSEGVIWQPGCVIFQQIINAPTGMSLEKVDALLVQKLLIFVIDHLLLLDAMPLHSTK